MKREKYYYENEEVGCDKEWDCRYYHPALCKQSKLRHDCKLQHLRNTRRAVPKTRPEATIQQTSSSTSFFSEIKRTLEKMEARGGEEHANN